MAPSLRQRLSTFVHRKIRQDPATKAEGSSGITSPESQRAISQPPTDEVPINYAEAVHRSLQSKLWDEAYDQLKAEKPDIVEGYQKILSQELQDGSETAFGNATQKDIIETDQDTRWKQMKNITQAGLEKIKREVQVEDSLEKIDTIKNMVDIAIKVAPDAAGIAWSGICLGFQVISNPTKQTITNSDGMKYIISRMDWYWHLSDLLLDSNTIPLTLDEPLEHMRIRIIDLYKQLLLYQMQSVLNYYQHRGLVPPQDLIWIGCFCGHINTIKNTEQAIIEDARSFNTLNTQRDLETLVSTGNVLLKGLQELELGIGDVSLQRKNGNEEELLKGLCIVDPDNDKKRIEDSKGGLLKDSYNWILHNKEFKSWIYNPGSQCLLIKGDPGKGKTMLLCGIIDELQSSIQPPHYFFCHATDVRFNSATAVLHGLLNSLVSKYSQLLQYIPKKYCIPGKSVLQDASPQTLDRSFKTFLRDPILAGQVFIIDGLDECIVGRSQLLTFITETLAKYNVKWLVSSRNLDDISRTLGPDDNKAYCSLELDEQSVSIAFRRYTEFRVADLVRKYNLHKSDEAKVLKYLNDSANANFLWVALVCDELSKTSRVDIEDLLEKFPPGLDILYRHVLEKVEVLRHKDVCHEILRLASIANRPLSIFELKSLMSSKHKIGSVDQLKGFISLCEPLLFIRDDIVSFVHQSAKDYLIEQAQQWVFPGGIDQHHYSIFSHSIQIISAILRPDMYNVRNPGALASQVKTTNPDPLGGVQYCCIFWLDHLSKAAQSKRALLNHCLKDEGELDHFLLSKLLNWLEAVSWLGELPEAIRALGGFSTQTIGKTNRTGKIIRDAYRFVCLNREIIETSPLQIYSSALIFSPINSLIRKAFEETQGADWITIKPDVQLEWTGCLRRLSAWDRSSIQFLAFSPSGKHLASLSSSSLNIWDLATGSCLREIACSPEKVTNGAMDSAEDKFRALLYSPDGACLLTLSPSGIKTWDLMSGERTETFTNESYRFLTMVFSSSGNLLTLVHDAQRGFLLLKDKFPMRTSFIHEVLTSDQNKLPLNLQDRAAMSPDGTKVAMRFLHSAILIVWDPHTGKSLWEKQLEGFWHCNAVFSPDGSVIAIANISVQIFCAETGTLLHTLDDHEDKVQSLAFWKDSTQLVMQPFSGGTKIWDITKGTLTNTHDSHNSVRMPVTFSPVGPWLLSASGSQIRIWDTPIKPITQRETHKSRVRRITLSPDGKKLLTASWDRAFIWDAISGERLCSIAGPFQEAAFSFDSSRFALSKENNQNLTIQVHNSITAELLNKFDTDIDTSTLAFMSNENLLATANWYRAEFSIWDIKTGSCQKNTIIHRKYPEYDDCVNGIAFSEDRSELKVELENDAIEVYDVETGEWLRRVRYSCGPFLKSRFSLEEDVHENQKCFNFEKLDASALLSQGDAQSFPVPELNINADTSWILKDEKPVLYIPPEYRPDTFLVYGEIVALGYRSGNVLLIRLSNARLDKKL